jgi:hypothetical protein
VSCGTLVEKGKVLDKPDPVIPCAVDVTGLPVPVGRIDKALFKLESGAEEDGNPTVDKNDGAIPVPVGAEMCVTLKIGKVSEIRISSFVLVADGELVVLYGTE